MFDYDFAMRDDFIGEATIAMTHLDLDKQTDQVLTLVETGKAEYLGQLSLSLRLVPKATEEPVSSSSAAGSAHAGASGASGGASGGSTGGKTSADGAKKTKSSHWSAIVNIVLVEGKDLLAMDLDGTSDPYCKFR